MADKDNLGHEAQQEEVTGETSVVEVPEKFRDEEGNLISDKLLKSYAEVEKSASKLAAERADLQRQLEDAKARADKNAAGGGVIDPGLATGGGSVNVPVGHS